MRSLAPTIPARILLLNGCSIGLPKAFPKGLVIAVGLALMAALLPGCEPRPTARPERPVLDTPFAPAWNAAAAAQSSRLQRLGQVFASGPVELSWNDEDGSHFETCRGELFVRLPSETALFLKKVGEPVFWLGSDARRRWLFDLRAKEPVVWLVDLDGPAQPRGVDAPFPIRRVSLVDLLGLVELPPADELDAIFDAPAEDRAGDGAGFGTDGRGRDRSGDLLVGEFYGDGGAVRVTIDTRTSLPVRVEALDDEGRPFLRGELGSYDTVERDGLAPGDLPRFAQRVAISVLDHSDATDGDADGARGETARSEVRLFLTPAVQGEGRITDQRFDLDVLTRTFKPVRTESR